VELDGRMLPHEWLITEAGYKKTDALDHHDDHFFPGAQDIAWDLAGAAVEFRMSPDALVDRYLREQRDPTLGAACRSIRSRISAIGTAIARWPGARWAIPWTGSGSRTLDLLRPRAG
jgi:hypothetical protein